MEMTLLSLVVAIVGVIPIFLAQASIIPLSVGVICFLAVALIGIYGLFRYMTRPNCIETVSYSQGPFTLVGVIGGVATLLLLFSIFVFSIMVVIAYYLSGKKTSDPRPLQVQE